MCISPYPRNNNHDAFDEFWFWWTTVLFGCSLTVLQGRDGQGESWSFCVQLSTTWQLLRFDGSLVLKLITLQPRPWHRYELQHGHSSRRRWQPTRCLIERQANDVNPLFSWFLMFFALCNTLKELRYCTVMIIHEVSWGHWIFALSFSLDCVSILVAKRKLPLRLVKFPHSCSCPAGRQLHLHMCLGWVYFAQMLTLFFDKQYRVRVQGFQGV